MPFALFLALVPPLFWTAANVRSISSTNSQPAHAIKIGAAHSGITKFVISQEDLYDAPAFR